MYSVLPELYHEIAVRLAEAVGDEHYFSGTIACTFSGMECRLVTSVIVYRRRLSLPEGDRDAIADLVPVWWEFHTSDEEGECLNDFDFSELKNFLL